MRSSPHTIARLSPELDTEIEILDVRWAMSASGEPTARVNARLRGAGPAINSVAVEIDRPGHSAERLPVSDLAPPGPLTAGTPFTVSFVVPRRWASGRFGYRLVAASAVALPPPTGASDTAPDPRRRGRAANWLCGTLLVCGFLLAADGALTMLWQDPVTAAYAAREQSALQDDLADQQSEWVATAASLPLPTGAPAPQRDDQAADDRALGSRLARMFRQSVREGDAIGTIAIDKIGVRFTMVEGASTEQLRRGPAHYAGTAMPGEAGTVAIAGHRTTYLAPFRDLDKLRRGDDITIDTPYGHFSYAVVQQGVVDPSAVGVLEQAWGAQWLVLTTCHPVRSAAERIVVVARLRSERVL